MGKPRSQVIGLLKLAIKPGWGLTTTESLFHKKLDDLMGFIQKEFGYSKGTDMGFPRQVWKQITFYEVVMFICLFFTPNLPFYVLLPLKILNKY